MSLERLLSDLKEIFHSLDVDKNAQLDENEFEGLVQIVNKTKGRSYSSIETKKLFEHIDKDSNRLISFYELIGNS